MPMALVVMVRIGQRATQKRTIGTVCILERAMVLRTGDHAKRQSELRLIEVAVPLRVAAAPDLRCEPGSACVSSSVADARSAWPWPWPWPCKHQRTLDMVSFGTPERRKKRAASWPPTTPWPLASAIWNSRATGSSIP